MSILNDIAKLIESLIQHAHFVSIALGFVISMGVTQLVKFPLRLYFYRKGLDPESKLTPEIEVEFHRWTVRLFAGLAGFVGTLATWPDGTWGYKLVWASAVCLASPTLYIVVCHFFPWLAEKATADRALDPPKP